MHCSQVSSGCDSAYQRTGSRQAAAAEGCKPAAADRGSERSARAERPQRSDEGRPARNPLVAAMMEALKGLAQPAPSASTDASTAAAPAASTDSAQSAMSVKEAAMNFANELYGALRAAGGSAPRSPSYGNRDGGYGNLAQGLQRLAQTVSAPGTPAPAPGPGDAAAPAPSPAVSVSKAAAPEPPRALKAAAPESPKKPSAPSPAPGPVTINISINFGGTPAVGAPAAAGTSSEAQASQDSPLLKAFKDLMAALNPTSDAGASDGADPSTAAQRLQAFLQQIARSLGGDALAQTPEAALPAKGSLVNLTA